MVRELRNKKMIYFNRNIILTLYKTLSRGSKMKERKVAWTSTPRTPIY